MSTETNNVFESEALSPAEAEYFSSKGEKAEGLAPAAEPAPAEGTDPGHPHKVTGPEGEPQTNEVDDDEGIYIDENGKPRSVISGKFVPHAALHKERERRKSVESEYMTVREKMARAEERLAVLNEVLQQPTAPQIGQPGQQTEEIPDPEKDIFAYVKYQAKLIEDLKAAQTKTVEETQRQQGFEQLKTAYAQDAQKFAAEKPDFKEAYSYIANSRARELIALGYNEGQIRQQLAQEETAIVAQAFQNRRSPAQVIYEQAMARGYTPKQAAAAANAVNPAQRLENVAKGQAAHKSLSGAGGAAGEGLTVEALANMSEEEFAAVSAKLGKSKLRSLMGG
jgi:hypothetical protein